MIQTNVVINSIFTKTIYPLTATLINQEYIQQQHRKPSKVCSTMYTVLGVAI